MHLKITEGKNNMVFVHIYQIIVKCKGLIEIKKKNNFDILCNFAKTSQYGLNKI